MDARLLVYKTGSTYPDLVARHGDKEHWFERALGLPGDRFSLYEPYRGAAAGPAPRPGAHDAVVVTGSPRSLAEPEPWMDDAAAFVLESARRGVPVLGVCFGHQLIGRAWGARIVVNPRGWEVGTIELELTEEGVGDPLFDGVPRRFAAHQSHRDVIAELPAGARRLAGGGKSELQAIAVGEHVRGVQFHPEMSPGIIRYFLDQPTHRVDRDRLLPAVRETPEARQVLGNFRRAFVGR